MDVPLKKKKPDKVGPENLASKHKIFPCYIKLLNQIKLIIKNSNFMILSNFNYQRKCLNIVIIFKHELY